ncbi:MAG: AraC family transcriptional regulator [Gammaproteobacteria bacterium]|nr:AraC family transcriptional regulator [Gammaproteobacteria bacterium]
MAALSGASAAGANTTQQPSESLEADIQSLKEEIVKINRDFFILEEELLFPANTQVVVFVSVDSGVLFTLDSVSLKLNDKNVANYLYTAREGKALERGGVQQLYIGNLRNGQHEIVAILNGKGPQGRSFRRGTSLIFEKSDDAKYIELKVVDSAERQQPEFTIREWE